MRFTPRSLRLERFGSFRKQQTLEFPRAPGLYFMQGVNEEQPRLSANGTGKTTLWNALTWLVHERTPEGLRAGDVCSWDADRGTQVSLEFSVDSDERPGLPQFMERTWKPNTWTLRDLFGGKTDLARDPQNPALAMLRLDLQAWLCCVLMAQGGTYFLDMRRDAQAALFGSVMGLDAWVERSERASRSAAEQDRGTRALEGRLAGALGRLEAIEARSGAGDAERWEERRRERLSRLEREYGEALERRKALRGALEAAQERESAARKGLAAAQPDAALEDDLAGAERELRRLEDERLQVGVRREALDDHLARLQDRGAACPVCGRGFDTKHWQQETERAERNLRAVLADHAQLAHKITVARNRRDVLDRRAREEEGALQAARRAVEDAAREASRARSDLALCERGLDGLEDAHDDAKRERNPHADAEERDARERGRLLDEVRELRRELDDSQRLTSVRQMWVRGFKEIRLREIAGALSELEVEANSSLSALGLPDWELEFRVDRETKAGTVQRGFSAFVRAPGAPGRAVPWEAWSGGERQRLRLAANMGLANLVRARTGCALPLEVWDEPTSGLSPEGKADLFAALAARARDESRVIFLVDHQAHDFGGFAGTCTVVKTPSGSRIRASWV